MYRSIIIAILFFINFQLSFSQNVDYIYPKNEIVNYTDSVIFQWNKNSLIDENTYHLQVSIDESFNVILIDTMNISGNTLKLFLPNSTAKYYWRCKKVEDNWLHSNIAKFYQFKPNHLDGLKLWYNTDSLEHTNNAINKIYDLSGNNNHLIQNNNSNKPALISSSALNKSTIRFDGSSDFLRGNFTDTIKPPYSIFVMWNLNVSKLAYCFDGVFPDPTNSLSTSPPYLRYQATSYLFYTQNMPFNFILTSLKINGANSKIYQNSVLKATSNPGNSYFKGLTLGASRYTESFLQGDIAELVVYQATLSDEDFSIVEKYFYSKFLPPVNLGQDIFIEYGFCDTTISASKNWYVSYVWNTGSTGPQINVSKSGTYSVTVTDIIGRTSIDSIKVFFPYVNTISESTICLNQSILWDTGLGENYNFNWYGSSSTSSSILISHQGQYAVMISDTNGCHYLTDTILISTDNFNIYFNQSDTSICLGNSIKISYASDSITSYLWNTGDLNSFIYPAISDTYYVVATNSRGCTAVDSIYVHIVGVAPNPLFSISGNCFNEETIFIDESFPQDSISTWLWTINNSITFNTQSLSYTFDEPGIQSVNLFVSSNNGCSKDTTILFEIHDIPSLSLTAPRICLNVPFEISPNINIPINQNISEYAWSIDGTLVSSDETLVSILTTEGVHSLSLSVLSSSGCYVTYDTIFVVSSEFPIPEHFSLVSPENGIFYNNDIIYFSWNQDPNVLYYEIEISTNQYFTDILYSSNTADNNTIIYPFWNNDTVYWHVKAYNHCLVNSLSDTRMLVRFSPNIIDNLACWYAADSTISVGGYISQCFDKSGNNNHLFQTVEINKPKLEASLLSSPVIDFDGNNDYLRGVFEDTIKSPFSIFLLWAVDESKTQYAIDGLLNDPTSNISLSHPYLRFQATNYLYYNRIMPFNFIVTTIISNGANSKISENGILMATANPGSSYYKGITLGASKFLGSFLNGKIGEVIIFDTVINDSISYIIESYLYKKYSPPVNLGYDIRVPYGFCDTAITTAYKPWFTSYLWSTGETDSIIHVNKPGIYSVTVTDIFGFQSSDDIRVFYPEVNQIGDSIVCLGQSIEWDLQLSGEYTYEWLGSSATSRSIIISDTGLYAAVITDNQGCKFYTDTIQFSFDYYALNASVGPSDTSLCSGNRLMLVSNRDETVAYQWSTGSSQEEIVVENSGIYSVTTTNYRGCTAVDDINVFIAGVVPVPDFVYSGQCKANDIQLNDLSSSGSGDIVFRAWKINGELFSNEQNPVLPANLISENLHSNGSYYIELTVAADDGCSDFTGKWINVYALPQVDFTPLQTCANSSTEFISLSMVDQASVDQNLWFIQGQNYFGNQVEVTFDEEGWKTVKLISVSDRSCVDSTIKQIYVKDAPLPTFEWQNACKGEEVYFINLTPLNPVNMPQYYLWDFDDDNFSNISNPVHSYELAGIYNVKLNITYKNRCEINSSANVQIYENPQIILNDIDVCETVAFSPDATIIDGEGVISEYIWKINATPQLESHSANPIFAISDTGTYTLNAEIISNFGCSSKGEANIIVHKNPDIGILATRTWGAQPLSVVFTATNGNLANYLWDFGDGNFAEGNYVNHVFENAGEYSVELKGISAYGCENTASVNVKVVVPVMDLVLFNPQAKVENNYLKTSVFVINNGTLPCQNAEILLNLGEGKIYREIIEYIAPSQVIKYDFAVQIYVADNKVPDPLCIEIIATPYESFNDVNTLNNLVCLTDIESLRVFPPYPNPTNDILVCEFMNVLHNDVRITIVNSIGKIVYFQTYVSESVYNKLNLNVANLIPGIYFLKVDNGRNSYSFKIQIL